MLYTSSMSWVPAAIGLAAGMLNRPPRAPRNPFIKELQRVMAEAMDTYDSMDTDMMIDRFNSDIEGSIRRNADVALRNLGAQRAATGQNPNLFSTERSVAEGVALRDVLRDAAIESAGMRFNAPAMRLNALSSISSMAQGGAQSNLPYAQMGFSQAMDRWRGINQGIGLLAQSIPMKK